VMDSVMSTKVEEGVQRLAWNGPDAHWLSGGR
jgi:hypothetical protein